MTSGSESDTTPAVAAGAGAAELLGSGDDRVDAALARLDALAGAPVTAHVQVFADVHRGLQEVLAAIDAEASAEPPAEPPADRPTARPPYPGPRP